MSKKQNTKAETFTEGGGTWETWKDDRISVSLEDARRAVAYKAHAEALVEALREIAQSILDTSKDGLDRSTSQLRKARKALANWEGAAK